MRKHIRGNGLRTASMLALAGLFFTLAFGSALMCVGVYRRTASDSDVNNCSRTALSYLANQVRRADERGMVAVGDFGGADALFLYEGDYVTCLYCYDGSLRELYTERNSGLTAADGLKVLDLASLSVKAEGEHLIFSVTDGCGAVSALTISPRCGIELAVHQ